MLSFLTHKGRSARGWDFCLVQQRGCLGSYPARPECMCCAIPSSKKEKQWRPRRSRILWKWLRKTSVMGTEGRQDFKKRNADLLLCRCWWLLKAENGKTEFHISAGKVFQDSAFSLSDWQNEGESCKMMKPHCIFAWFFWGKKCCGCMERNAWREVEGVSKTPRKGLKMWEVRFIYLGGAKLALEEMMKRDSMYGDKN